MAADLSHPDLPARHLARQQADWLSPARSRLLRRVQIATRRRVLDLGCGYGLVTRELAERCGGKAIGLDRRSDVLAGPEWPRAAARVCGDAHRLPFASASFDLVYCQFALMWTDVERALAEVRRVLGREGVLVALEPDYGGLMEHPAEIATVELWRAGLVRAGAEPCLGRRLPALLRLAGFETRVDLLDRLEPPSSLRFDLLAELPLVEPERAVLETIRQADAALGDFPRVAHLPIFLVTARRR